MRRFFTMAIVILMSFLVQTTILQKLALADVVPNLLLIITVTFGYMRGEKEGMFTGFFCGLLVDCVYGEIVGLYTLLYLVIGYLNGPISAITESITLEFSLASPQPTLTTILSRRGICMGLL